jgi:hypothetical protein
MSAASRFAELLLAFEARVLRWLVFSSLHPYRVQRQVDGRLNLQAVNEKNGLGMPEIPSVPKAHGTPGVREECRPGTIVLVGFQGGNPKAPFVAHYLEPVRAAGETETPSTPLSLEIEAQNTVQIEAQNTVEIEAQTEIRVGAGAAQGAARIGDSVTVLLPPATFVGKIGGVDAVGMVVWSPGQTIGTITTGSAKVRIE